MRCPYCGSLDTQVKDSRPTDDSASIRRRRVCPDCGGRFTTFERVQLRELTVVKKSGRRAPFDRDKLVRSVQIALRKRPVDPERVDRMLNGLVRQLENQGESEIPSDTIGELVMQGLKTLDEVAYVRFASVYRNFREARDFGPLLDEFSRTTALPRASQGRGRLTWLSRADDERFFRAALALGRRNLGAAAPNPAVGALVVRDDVVVGRGWTAIGRAPARRNPGAGAGGRRLRGARRFM